MKNAWSYTLEELESMPTIRGVHDCDLKVQDGLKRRVWLSRMTVADGAKFDNEVVVERFNLRTGVWQEVASYAAGAGRPMGVQND